MFKKYKRTKLTRKMARAIAWAVKPVVKRLDAQTIKRLATVDNSLGRAILSLGAVSAVPAIQEVERFRATLIADTNLLADGTLGEPGIYDDKETVHGAVLRSKPRSEARLLYALAHEYQPNTVIELGTNVGISSAYIAAGLNNGRLITFESSPYRLRVAQELHQNVGLTRVDYRRGLFKDTLPPSLDELPPVDMAFIDGHHQYQPTLDYFNLIWKHSTERCVFIFDDIRWSKGMRRAWRELQRDPRMALVVDLMSLGVGVTTRSPAGKPYRPLPIRTAFH